MLKQLSLRARITRYFSIACAAYVLLVNVVCMLLRPQLFDHPHWGVSYFGSQPITFIPYYGGLVLIVACLVGITCELRRVTGRWRFLYYSFWAVTALAAAIAATSYMDGGPFIFWAHIIICFVLLLVALIVQIWALIQPGTHWYEYVSMGILLVGTVLLNLSSEWANVLGIYAWSEMILFVAVLIGLGTAAVRAVDAIEAK